MQYKIADIKNFFTAIDVREGITFLKAYLEYNQLNLPITEKIHNQTLIIPMDPTLSNNNIEIGDKEIKEALIFNKNLLIENFIYPNKLRLPLFRNILENYYS